MRKAVDRVTGNVRVNGDFVKDEDKAAHVEVLSRGGYLQETKGSIVKFKSLTKGFSKEVKLTRGRAVRAK